MNFWAVLLVVALPLPASADNAPANDWWAEFAYNLDETALSSLVEQGYPASQISKRAVASFKCAVLQQAMFDHSSSALGNAAESVEIRPLPGHHRTHIWSQPDDVSVIWSCEIDETREDHPVRVWLSNRIWIDYDDRVDAKGVE